MKTTDEYESIKIKMKKLLALAEQGLRGEAENARRLLEKLCRQYGVSIEELLDENKTKWYCFETGRNDIYKDLFSQCYYKVTQTSSMPYKELSRSSMAVELTAMQHAELVSLFEWHKVNFNQDLEDMKKNFLIAYLRKHRLYSEVTPEDENEHKELTSDERKRLYKILMMQENLNDNQYHKLLK